MGKETWTKGNIDGRTEFSTFEEQLYADWVSATNHHCFNDKTTTIILKLHNGFEIVGSAGCEHPENFSEEVGYIYALKDALRKLGEFTAFYRAQYKYDTGQRAVTAEPIDIHSEYPKEIQYTNSQRAEIATLVVESVNSYLRTREIAFTDGQKEDIAKIAVQAVQRVASMGGFMTGRY